MKDELIYWYFRLREVLVLVVALLILVISAYLLVFQTELFMNIALVIIATAVGGFLLLFAGVAIWVGVDKLFPADPRKSKDTGNE